MSIDYKILKEVLDQAEFKEEESTHFFSVNLEILEDFKRKHNKDFHALLDTMHDEDKSELLSTYYK